MIIFPDKIYLVCQVKKNFFTQKKERKRKNTINKKNSVKNFNVIFLSKINADYSITFS